jgi:hypothetical protein
MFILNGQYKFTGIKITSNYCSYKDFENSETLLSCFQKTIPLTNICVSHFYKIIMLKPSVMRYTKIALLSILLSVVSVAGFPQSKINPNDIKDKMQWFAEAKLSIFINAGIYSVGIKWLARFPGALFQALYILISPKMYWISRSLL